MASSQPRDGKHSPSSDANSSGSASAAASQGQVTSPEVAQSAQAELAKAFQDLARGEQHAATLEANLSSLESKLDALLASIGEGPGGVKIDDFGSPEDREDGKDRKGRVDKNGMEKK